MKKKDKLKALRNDFDSQMSLLWKCIVGVLVFSVVTLLVSSTFIDINRKRITALEEYTGVNSPIKSLKTYETEGFRVECLEYGERETPIVVSLEQYCWLDCDPKYEDMSQYYLCMWDCMSSHLLENQFEFETFINKTVCTKEILVRSV